LKTRNTLQSLAGVVEHELAKEQRLTRVDMVLAKSQVIE
jgi:hypothetical protein